MPRPPAQPRPRAAPPPALTAASPACLGMLALLLDAIEPGMLLLSRDGRVLAANAAMAELLDVPAAAILAMTADALLAHLRGLMNEVPEMLASGDITARRSPVACEELELVRPSRSVVRWVARQVELPGLSAQLVSCTDITGEVELVRVQQRMATTDRLTGLLNRRGLETVIERERARGQRAGSALTFVLCDIDHFKRVNDVHGHAAGDEVLRRVGAALAGTLRAGDVCGRWGGEEFLAVLCATDLPGARACAERLRGAVEALDLPTGTVTLSAGIARCEPGEPAAAAIDRADAALYRAKSSGRNRVE